MSLIVKSGYLQVLQVGPCAWVAKIISSNGNATQYLATKRQALEIGEALVGIGVTEEEWKAIHEQIHASPLISRNKDLEEYYSDTQAKFEDLTRKLEQVLKELKHELDSGEEWKKGF